MNLINKLAYIKSWKNTPVYGGAKFASDALFRWVHEIEREVEHIHLYFGISLFPFTFSQDYTTMLGTHSLFVCVKVNANLILLWSCTSRCPCSKGTFELSQMSHSPIILCNTKLLPIALDRKLSVIPPYNTQSYCWLWLHWRHVVFFI